MKYIICVVTTLNLFVLLWAMLLGKIQAEWWVEIAAIAIFALFAIVAFVSAFPSPPRKKDE